MDLNYENTVQSSSGYDYEFAETVQQVRIRIRIHADKSYPNQSFATGEIWRDAHGWVECATLLRGSWIHWGKPSPTQDTDCVRSIEEAADELRARIAATLNF